MWCRGEMCIWYARLAPGTFVCNSHIFVSFVPVKFLLGNLDV